MCCVCYGRWCGFARSVEQGAWPVVWAAVSKEMQGVGGVYTENCHLSVPSPEARSRTVQSALWDNSMELIEAHMQA